MNEKIPSHTTGVMSTPNAGGTDPLSSRKKGSVGQTTMLNGTSLTFADGYHESTMRHSYFPNRSQKKCGWEGGGVAGVREDKASFI
jgi:hypothetical protein